MRSGILEQSCRTIFFRHPKTKLIWSEAGQLDHWSNIRATSFGLWLNSTGNKPSINIATATETISSHTPNSTACYHPKLNMTSSQYLLAFLSLVVLAGNILGEAAKCHPDDEAGLLGFKSGIQKDPSGLLKTWISGTNCCQWNGISCYGANSTRVSDISVGGQLSDPNSYLSGTISPLILKLEYLDSIALQGLKYLTGPFPEVFFKLPNLEYIYITDSQLSGFLPADIGNLTKLSSLQLEGNRFSGAIPSSIGKLTLLTQLNLGRNSFSGGLPSSLGSLKNLNYFNLAENQLYGTIPDLFSSFSELRILNFSNNKFLGKIPTSMSSLAPKLQYLDLSHNALTGAIPEFLGRFTTLDTLTLSWNGFTGIVPKSFVNLTKIFTLDLGHNYLIDPLPQMKVIGIESLDLSYNRFHLGEIPSWVTTSDILTSLKLAGCGIKIRLEDWKPKQTYFIDNIDLSDNEISGSPVTLLNTTDYLKGFWAKGNKMQFKMDGLRIAKTLKYLDLSKNLVYGKLPVGVAKLASLNVSYNHLCGQIPASSFPASAFAGNDCLCGSPLPACK
ncbi:hypothetical protein Droror1_Dr00000404 [Drosera rotundifolia]